jgi:uncharacterized membrane protein
MYLYTRLATDPIKETLMIQKLQFWTLVVALATYVAKYFYPDLPLAEADILAGVLFLLGLIGVVPTVRGIRKSKYGATIGDLFKSLAFWTLVAGLIGFVVHFYAPEFPYSNAVILAVIIWVLNQIGINPQLRIMGFVDDED